MVANIESFSFSASKPELVVKSWLAHGFNINVIEPIPITLMQLYRAHHREYVDDILACRIPNGFDNRSKVVAQSLIYTSGAMLAAAKEALLTRSFVCAPVAGFHHACWKKAEDYCTFNGLMIAALDLLRTKVAKRIGILDCDNHYGNGTDDIIENVCDDKEVIHFTTGRERHQPDSFLATLSERIKSLYSTCDLLLYQAGADPHIDDPLGGWMTTKQLFERDQIVFKTARLMNLPVAWNLAGGYQRDENGEILPVLRIHDNTMRACLSQLNVGFTNKIR